MYIATAHLPGFVSNCFVVVPNCHDLVFPPQTMESRSDMTLYWRSNQRSTPAFVPCVEN
jgi:hypothetical protein